ncbi:PREDICTED: anaphase-promoting complex subunit 5-like isoform X1 [Priapulus caudatus]|uniref:Anaphase-promoting complex subunit 5 n=1 Tax=Priapulus caudatus TaxID=37621 RepID=A0ABM1E203_PRICU|nr:PREDICTED: anaphase-promoting complex subunit 5-like isoform X1 [Priapulus caudatus]XP_014666223.1 PREDICTED: anaphase-promoting complex subunit 5-like isoform X2 [Priapulus caudatus]XP_014666224.1 PREDICTED: anaphase-promoting complex subunit 5-like isoform X1 [Priapulus caudatus]
MAVVVTDIPRASQHPRLLLKDQVTPHKVSMLILIKEYLTMTSKDKGAFTSCQRRDFAIMVLTLLQSPDISVEALIKMVKEIDSQCLLVTFIEKLRDVYNVGVGSLMDNVRAAYSLLTDMECNLHKSSIVGFFIRRLYLGFERLSFNKVASLCKAFKSYCKAICTEETLGSDFDDSTLPIELGRDESSFTQIDRFEEALGIYTQKQAEYVLAQQTTLLQRNDKNALSPKKLQDMIGQLLHSHPNLAEAHYLSYLNSLRLKDYCRVIDSMYHYFDRCLLSGLDNKTNADDIGRSCRYAALNLAGLHYRFAHKEEALAAVNEAIRMAQETNDNVCLQHALGWLYRIQDSTGGTTHELLERSITKAGELNLSYLASVGVQSYARQKALAKVTPACVFDFLVKSDILNCQHSQLDLLASSYALKAALWHRYGNSSMRLHCSQTLLHLHLSDPAKQNVYYNGEAICIALCNLANYHADQGDFHAATEVIGHAKHSFPAHGEHAKLWMQCEQAMLFDRAVYQSDYDAADLAVRNMAAVSDLESRYRRALLLLSSCCLTEAFQILHELKEKCSQQERSSTNECSTEFHASVLIALGQYHAMTPYPSNAIQHLTACIALCSDHHLHYMRAIATLHIASVQLQMDLPNQAKSLIESVMITVLSNGSLFEKSRASLLYAKCLLQASTEDKKEDRHLVLQRCIGNVNISISGFRMLEASTRLKDSVYCLALLYNELGNMAARNNCALQFKELDAQYPTANSNSGCIF